MSDYEEETKSREISRKIMEEIGIFETKIKNIRELIIDIIERIKKIEIKLEKLKISKTIVDTIKKSAISEKCLHHISRHFKI